MEMETQTDASTTYDYGSVVLVDDEGAPIGSAQKHHIHTAHTPLHLAFSCYLSDHAGRLLLTRRALAKRTWPGVWTNSFCGHPAPGEPIADAIHRHAATELGARLTALRLVLPSFRYTATDAGGIVENEICPVYRATLVGEIQPNPAEVAEYAWVDIPAINCAVATAPFAFSPWMVSQLNELSHASEPGGRPLGEGEH